MNVATIQASLLSINQVPVNQASTIQTGFAQQLLPMLMQLASNTETLETGNPEISHEELQSLLQLLSVSTETKDQLLSLTTGKTDSLVETNTLLDSNQLVNLEKLVDLDTLLLIEEEEIPMELISMMQQVSGMDVKELLQFISNQSNGDSGEELITFTHLSKIAQSLETNFSKGEPPTQAIVKMLELLKVVELAGSRIPLPQKEAEAFEQLKLSLSKITESLQAVLHPKRNEVIVKAYESYRAFSSNEPVLARMDVPQKVMGQTDAEIKKSSTNPFNPLVNSNPTKNESSVKPFEGNLSFLSTLKQPIIDNVQMGGKQQPVSFHQFAEKLTQLMQKSHFSESNGIQKLFVKLHPEHLGTLRIEIMKQDGIITAKLLASTQVAKELIDTQLQGLKNSFGHQHIQVEKMEAAETLSQQQERSFQNRDQQKQQSHSQHQQGQHQEQQENEPEDFQSVLFEFMV